MNPTSVPTPEHSAIPGIFAGIDMEALCAEERYLSGTETAEAQEPEPRKLHVQQTTIPGIFAGIDMDLLIKEKF